MSKNPGNHEIKKGTIDKYLCFFEEIKILCDNHKEISIHKIAASYKMAGRVFYSAVELNYFNRIGFGLYRCLVGKFERTHIRNLIEHVNIKYEKGAVVKAHHTNKDLSLYQNTNIDIDNCSKLLMSIPPDVEDVKKYCDSRKNNIDPEIWYAYYVSKDWMVGKNKMKDWKRAVVTWEINQKRPIIANKPSSNFTPQQHWDELKKAGYVIINGELVKKLT